eukprot:TRINITY_DN20471_c0_g1_i3.p1 TRINITY_DN20471_c0_g1~~TRINITY_DN20471_c0_g1_i3.p1  ORF type:complete len:530 (+),score=112.19 TRINITY_DN20471_c0_g1_i3:56-1645(+)
MYIKVLFIFFFFFKQKTAYEMLRSLVGSEMCIRDRFVPPVFTVGILVPSTIISIALLVGYPVQYAKYAQNNAQMPAEFGAANVHRNVLVDTPIGLCMFLLCIASLWLCLAGGSLLFGFNEAQVQRYPWLLGNSRGALVRWSVAMLVFMLVYNWFYGTFFMMALADIQLNAVGSMISLALWPSPAEGRWATPELLEHHTANADSTIPKIIHQTYKVREPLPGAWNSTPDAWQKMHPGWDYKFWTDVSMREFVEKEYSWFLPTYDAYQYPIQRADVIRYLAVYHYGGIYADLDLQPLTSMEPYLKGTDVLVFETPNLGLTNMILAGKQGSSFLRCTIAQLMGRQTSWGHWVTPYKGFQILSSSGPTFWWAMASPALCGKAFNPSTDGEAQVAERLRILSPSFMGRCSICRGAATDCHKKGVLKHLVGSSWHIAKTNTSMSHFVFLCQPAVTICLVGVLFKIFWLVRQVVDARMRERNPHPDVEDPSSKQHESEHDGSVAVVPKNSLSNQHLSYELIRLCILLTWCGGLTHF